MLDEEYEDEEAGLGSDADDPASLLSDAFPDFSPDQIAALKEYIHSCIDDAGPGKASKPAKKGKKGDSGLALIFGEEE